MYTNRTAAAGVRAFIHKGSTIVSPMENFDHFSFVAKNTRKISPDSLQAEHKMLKIEIIGNEKTITDGTRLLEAYVLGNKSGLSDDYIFYYLPAEKLILDECLINILNDGATIFAQRQTNLYNAIKEHNLQVETIIQLSTRPHFKNIITFSELEKSILGK
jgi:hypothetical protein